MFGYSDSNDYQPYGYLGRIPLYLTTILVITYVTFMVMVSLCAAANNAALLTYLPYDSAVVRAHLQFWRLLTYPLFNGPTIWFAIEMYLLYSFGREVERFLGRTAFGMLYFFLVALASCLLTVASPFVKGSMILAGSNTINFAVFVAFCSIYPSVEICLRIQAKWLAAIFIGIDSLWDLANHAIIELFALWVSCLGAFLFIKYLRGQIQLPRLRDYFRTRASRRNLRPMPSPRPTQHARPTLPNDGVLESIDPLLDKIAKHGIGSLTQRERDKLEEARTELLKKPTP